VQFLSDGEIYKVVRITGPTHNFLGLAFMQPKTNGIVSVEPITMNAGEIVRLRADEVREQVMEGIKEANAELGANYHPRRIQFVPSDSTPVEIYRMLAKRIIQRLHTEPESYQGTVD